MEPSGASQTSEASEVAPGTLGLSAWFLHVRLVLELLGKERAAVARAELDLRQDLNRALPATSTYVLTTAVEQFLVESPVPELAREHLLGTLEQGQVVGIQQEFFFKRVRDRRLGQRIEMHAPLATDRSVKVTAWLNPEHMVSPSSNVLLSGRSRAYAVAHVLKVSREQIELRPILVGHRFTRPLAAGPSGPALALTSDRRVFPKDVQEFQEVRHCPKPEGGAYKILRRIPEEQVKHWFAEIVGEPFVPKDWGGEILDLYSGRLSINGQSTAAAFAFKGGPGHFQPMTIKALGKQGDQIDRLYRAPAGLLVLQHCHEVRLEVVNMMDVYAWDLRRPRRFMVLDGQDTVHILRACGKL